MTDRELYLGIDTSNYTTSFSLVDNAGKVVLNFKKLLPVSEGKCGLRQSDAVFAHIKQIPVVADVVRDYIRQTGTTVIAVGYSHSPRDVEGSYMPCFLPGEAVASSVSAVLDVPMFHFSHQAGHIRAAVYSANCEGLLNSAERFAAMHISGGTTEILSVRSLEGKLAIDLIGGTDDISAGQAIDRIGVMMNMPFPAGRHMEQAAKQYHGEIYKPKLSVHGYSFNLSGIENIAKKLYSQNHDISEVSAFTIDFIARTLKLVRNNVLAKYGDIPMIFSGGVMSCEYIKQALNAPKMYFAAPEYSSDNAAGIALLTRDMFLRAKSLENL